MKGEVRCVLVGYRYRSAVRFMIHLKFKRDHAG